MGEHQLWITNQWLTWNRYPLKCIYLNVQGLGMYLLLYGDMITVRLLKQEHQVHRNIDIIGFIVFLILTLWNHFVSCDTCIVSLLRLFLQCFISVLVPVSRSALVHVSQSEPFSVSASLNPLLTVRACLSIFCRAWRRLRFLHVHVCFPTSFSPSLILSLCFPSLWQTLLSLCQSSTFVVCVTDNCYISF